MALPLQSLYHTTTKILGFPMSLNCIWVLRFLLSADAADA